MAGGTRGRAHDVRNSLTCGLILVAGVASADELLLDEFDGPALDTGTWGLADWTIGDRTQFGNQPTFGVDGSDTYISLPLDTWNPSGNGARLFGTEIYSLQQFDNTGGVEFLTRARLVGDAPGLVAAFFTYNQKRNKGKWISDEIDYEVLSKQPTDTVLVTSWNDWGSSGSNYEDGTHHKGAFVFPADFDWTDWNFYAIRWYADRVEWWINGMEVNSFDSPVPDMNQPVRASLWAGGTTWPDAYSPLLAPAATAADNQRYEWQLDFIMVSRLAGGGGNDLSAPSNLSAEVSGNQVALSWKDNSAGEEGFRVYRAWKPKGKANPDFIFAAATGPDSTAWVDTVQDGSFLYRITSYAGADESAPSETVTVTVGTGGPGKP